MHADASDSWKRIYTKEVTNGRVIKGLLMELTSRHHHNGDSPGTKKLRNNFINRDRPTATNANVQLDGDCKLLLHLQSDYWAPFHSTQSINAPLPLLNMPPHFYSLLHCRPFWSSIGRTGLWPEIGNFYCASKNNGFMMISTTFLSTSSIPIGSSYHYGTLFSL